MKMQISRQFIAVLALLWSSVGMAGAITSVLVNPSNPTPIVGDEFTVLVQGTGFPETAGATLGLTWNTAVVDVLSVAVAPGSPFTGGVVAEAPWSPITILGPLVGALPIGDFDTFLITFSAIATGSADIVLVDDQSDLCWSDAATFGCVTPVTYTQAIVNVISSPEPNIVVTDSVDPADDQTVAFGNVDVGISEIQTVTITNSGTADLTISSVTSPQPDFSLTGNCALVIPPAGTCTLDVQFIPAANGAASSSFDIVSDDPGTPTVTVNLTGTGGFPDIAVTDADGVDPNDQLVQFGDVQVTLNDEVNVTITNNGVADLQLTSITAPADARFSVVANFCGLTLTPAASCNITVRFAPTATGVVNSSFDINSDDPDSPTVTVDLTGNGTPAPTPDIAVTDSDPSPNDLVMAFGDVQVGQTSAPVTVTVTNNGAADLVVSNVSGLAAPFAVTGETCTPAPLVTSATCTITVVFSPTAVGPAPGDTLTISSNDPDAPTVDVLASGTGLPIPAPDIAVTDDDAAPNDNALSFGNLRVGATSAPITVTVSNTGDAVLNVGQVAGANPLPLPYTISNDTCSNTAVAASGGSCTFQVRFAPTVAGNAPEAFDIPSNDADENPVIVTVNGNGTAPNIAVTDSVGAAGDLAVPFGTVPVGQTSVAATVTVTNSGTAPLDVSGVSGLAAPYSVTGETCTAAPIAIAGTCTITVVFAPTVAGPAANDTLTIASDDPDTATVDVVMSGAGGVPEISVATSIDFGDVAEGDTGTETLTVTNSGTAPLAIGAVTSPDAPFEIAANTCSNQSIAAAGTCTITVEFTPDAVGSFDSDFDIPSNDADEAVVNVEVIGDGVAGGGLRSDEGGSSIDPATLLGLGLAGLAFKRRRRN